jgi:hypothetical protein
VPLLFTSHLPAARRRRSRAARAAHAVSGAVDIYVQQAESVASSRRFVDPQTLALVIGGGRTLIGLAFGVAPITAVRSLGVDGATAARMEWLARMTAARDTVLGAGTLAAVRRRQGARSWLIAGAAADAVDAVALTAAAKSRRVGGVGAWGCVALGAGAAAAGLWAAVGARRR